MNYDADNPLSWPNLTIPEDAWEPQADSFEDPWSRLGAAFTINGHPLHLEAWALADDSEGIQVSLTEYPDDLDHISAISGDGGRFMTTTIKGREYMLVAYSFYH